MARSPEFKVYNPEGEYIAAMKHLEDAAAVVALYGEGTTIRYGHTRVLWREGAEKFQAQYSYDGTAAICRERLKGAKS